MHQLSSYRRLLPLPLLLLLHWKEGKRQAGTELQHRGGDEKPTASLLSPQKTEQSCTESQLNRPADVKSIISCKPASGLVETLLLLRMQVRSCFAHLGGNDNPVAIVFDRSL